MKSAQDYARQALRFAERAMVEPDATAIRQEWRDAYEDGQRYARKKDASERSREAYGNECASEAEEAMRAARAARRPHLWGFWAESWRAHACERAKLAAWCAGYAAGV